VCSCSTWLLLLQRHLVPAETLRSTLLTEGAGGGGLPILKSCLADDDTTTRHMATLLLDGSLALLRGTLDPETGRSLYHEALKRLDDSNDAVRISACGALAQLAIAPPVPAEAWRGTPVEYVIDTLLLHLDDPSPSIQAAVFEALGPWALTAPTYARKAALAAADKHRSPLFCERLLSLLPVADSLQ
jgi:hypothetical protein